MSDNFGSGVRISGDTGMKGVHAGGAATWDLQVSADAKEAKIEFFVSTGPDADNAPEWNVALYDTGGEIWNNYMSRKEVSVDIQGNKPKDLKLEVICPKGARYGDTVTIELNASGPNGNMTAEFSAMAAQSIMVLKTQMDQEKSVADSLLSKANIGEKDIFAILSPGNLRGYLFVEGMNTEQLREKTRDIRKARSFVDGETSLEEIDHYLTPLSTVIGIVEGDIVELVNGPFKGEKARVQQIDQGKEEITVELIEAMVPIPVTVKGDSVRVLEKER
jgi:ribosomal protein L24p/L26e, archaeal